ncbi:BAD_collapsed_G0004850.mRNA.1.CDS.1 [Saccharomyces cerevisiae]|nr:BAD_HP_G0034520.mRNA.1.CDS.1 [Saccharomyces cerevisiae]CAI6660133.1 BAD_HP_G0034520.mRNA.1.CDS.1 [Saccharomyces cerevisiae]CAI7161320.1 BAD_collapsed_G0004850.mRNA.1.CDS.1 [Saccharomyces cerevisiae]
MYLSFYITDTKNKLIFQYLLGATAPSFKHLWTRVQSTCPQLLEDSSSDDYLDHSMVGRDLEVYKYFSVINKLNYWCLASTSKSKGPLDCFTFLETIDRILLEYFDKDKLSIKKIVNNYDRISLIFNCCVEAGEPNVSDMLYVNKIKEAVPERSDLSKFISSTAHNLQQAVQLPQQRQQQLQQNQISRGSSSLIENEEIVPWRTSRASKHENNELYVDLLETFHVVFEKKKSHLRLLTGSIHGIVDVRSYLNDNPLVAVKLNTMGNDIGIPSLHDCVEINDGVFSPSNITFIPPDGKFRLLEYSVDLNSQVKQSGVRMNSIGLMSLNFQNGLGKDSDEFELSLNIENFKKVSQVDDLKIDLQFNVENADPNEIAYKIKILRNTHGRFENSIIMGQGQWIFDKSTATGTVPVLRGCIEYENTGPNFTKNVDLQTVSLEYSYIGQSASGIYVEAIDIVSGLTIGKNTKLYKGAKYKTQTGNFQVRL